MKKKLIVTIGDSDITIKEYKGQRIVTFKDIDTVHARPEGTAKRNFSDNRKRFVEGEDYFILKPDDSQKYDLRTLEIPNRGLTVMTEQGYLMLVKPFTDDLSWEVQRKLVASYFKKEAPLQKDQDNPKRLPLSSVNMMVKNVMSTLEKAKVEPVFVAAEVKRLYTDLGYEVKAPLLTNKETMPKLYDCTEMAKELGIYSTSGKPHNQAVSAIIKKLHISDSEIMTTAFSRNGHDDVTIQYKPSVLEDVKLWLAENNYPTKIPCMDSKGNQKTCTVAYREP